MMYGYTDDFLWAWDMLTDNNIATSEEIGLVVALNGSTIEVLESILYIRTGYRNFEQWLGENDEYDEE